MSYYIEIAYPCESRLAEQIADQHESEDSNVMLHAGEGGVVACLTFDSKLRFGTAVSEGIEQADEAIDNAAELVEQPTDSLSADPWSIRLIDSELMAEALRNMGEGERNWLARKDDDGYAGSGASA